MRRWFHLLNFYFLSSPILRATEQESYQRFQRMLGTSAVSPEVFIELLVVIMVVVALILYGAYRYQRWKRYKEFVTEMKALDLDPNTEGAFAGMVRRYAMAEPVSILFSARLFDEMATAEILRVLGSAGSQKSKEEFVNTVYNIRNHTYHSEWDESRNQLMTDKPAKDSPKT